MVRLPAYLLSGTKMPIYASRRAVRAASHREHTGGDYSSLHCHQRRWGHVKKRKMRFACPIGDKKALHAAWFRRGGLAYAQGPVALPVQHSGTCGAPADQHISVRGVACVTRELRT